MFRFTTINQSLINFIGIQSFIQGYCINDSIVNIQQLMRNFYEKVNLKTYMLSFLLQNQTITRF